MTSSNEDLVKRLGGEPEEIVQELSSDDPDLRGMALNELVSRGKRAVPALVKALKSKDPAVRFLAAEGLAQLADPSSAESLASALKDSNGGVRSLAATGLARMKDKRGLPALIDTLDDYPDLAHLHLTRSAYTLMEMGPAALPMVVPLLLDKDALRRTTAIWIIRDIVSNMPGEDWETLYQQLGSYDPDGPEAERNASAQKWADWVKDYAGKEPPNG